MSARTIGGTTDEAWEFSSVADSTSIETQDVMERIPRPPKDYTIDAPPDVFALFIPCALAHKEKRRSFERPVPCTTTRNELILSVRRRARQWRDNRRAREPQPSLPSAAKAGF